MASTQKMGRNLKIFLLSLLLSAGVAAHASTYYVTIAGLGGTPEYEAQFTKWNTELDSLLRKNGPGVTIETRYGANATRESLQQLFKHLAEQVHPDDAFALLLIGHGTYDGTAYKFNLPGPDITSGELAAMMNRVPASEQLVVNMTSASGASLAALAKKDRIVITATKTGNEKNATVFARYWIDALRDPVADTNKNGAVSALEAFRYAESKTAAYFQAEKLLATEHPLLSDTGASTGVRDPTPENGQGELAAMFPLLKAPAETAQNVDPAKQNLMHHKQQLENKIDQLKYRKAAMQESEYKQQLTALLLQLARTQAEIDK